MKKLCAAFAAIMTVATILLCSSCGTDSMKNVSERRSSFFTASGGGITVTAVSGVREDPYTADGKVGELKPYTLITLVPAEFDIDAVYTYSVSANGTAYGGSMIVHPFAASFSAEYDAETTAEFVLEIKCGEQKLELEMKSLVTSDMLSYDRAIDAAVTALRPSGEYEIRARLIKNPLDDSGICWHVAFITADGDSGVLLDPTTAKVLAKK